MIRYSKADRQQAARLYKKGWGYKRIADVIGCYPSTIKQWVEAAKLEKHPGPAHTAEKRRAAITLYEKNPNMSLEEAAFHMGVNGVTLSRWIKADGIAIHPQQRVRRVFDHEAIRKDLSKGMVGVEVALKHKCSESLVSRIKGKNEEAK